MWKRVMALCLMVAQAAVGGAAVAETQKVFLYSRFYLIDLPARPNGSVIVALHNAAGNAKEFREQIVLTQPALADGYAVIYPQGSGSSWNGFYCCGPAQKSNSPDIRFLDRVIADATARFKLQPGQVYLTGMGNGSVMAETYAARRPDTVKAVAGVAGTVDLGRSPATRVPMLHIHGSVDTVVPYGQDRPGAGSKRRSGTFPTVPLQIAAFVEANGPLTKTSRMIDRVDDGTSVQEDNYADVRGRVQVRLVTIVGGQHVWPAPFRKGKGNTRDISATTEVLRFFAEHP